MGTHSEMGARLERIMTLLETTVMNRMVGCRCHHTSVYIRVGRNHGPVRACHIVSTTCMDPRQRVRRARHVGDAFGVLQTGGRRRGRV
jgi:hypothetical protein